MDSSLQGGGGLQGAQRMKVVSLGKLGGLECREEPFPVPKDDEVLIEVLATGVNKLDIWRTHAEYELPLDWNSLPGLECTGKIIEVGKNVQKWKVGNQICALLNGGGYAQAVVVRATQVFPLPLDISYMYQLACLPEAACTTWEAISRLGKLSANRTLLVYERCGKICDLAVQVAEMLQAKVIVARDDWTISKRFDSRAVVFNMNCPSFIKLILGATNNEGVDVILDCDISSIENPRILKPGGKIVLVELGPESLANVNLVHFCSYNAMLHVINRMEWPDEYMSKVVMDMVENMWPAFTNGILVPPNLGRMYMLSEADKARVGDIITP